MPFLPYPGDQAETSVLFELIFRADLEAAGRQQVQMAGDRCSAAIWMGSRRASGIEVLIVATWQSSVGRDSRVASAPPAGGTIMTSPSPG